MENQMFVRFPSLSVNEGFARVVVASFAAQLNPTLEELADIKTAVSEAVTNAIVHGYEGMIGTVEISARIRERQIIIDINDQGKGIEDVEMARQPFFTTAEGSERSGMGFTVMETFMDSLEVVSHPGKGTTVTMSKAISPVQGTGSERE